jgi:tetratricopeptide (TPR) repeat protein
VCRCAGASRQTLEHAEKELGKDHPATIASLNNLALIYKAQGRYGEAEPLYKQVLEALERALGQDRPNTLAASIISQGSIMPKAALRKPSRS